MINLLQLFYITRSLSTNSHVAANLQKVIHVLVGLLMQRTSCRLLLWKVGLGKLKSKGVRNCKSVTRFYCWRWINNSGEFSYVEYVCSLGLPKFQCTWSALAGGFISRAVGFIHEWQRTVFCYRLVTGDKTWIYHWAPLSKLEFMQWKDVDRSTFTRICKSAITG